MSFFEVILLTGLTGALSVAVDVEMNNKCSYTSGKMIFTCQGLSYVNKDIAKFITEDTHLLILKNTTGDIRFETDHHSNVNFKQIVSYDIVDNEQVEIEEFAFRGLTNLRYMKIRGNNGLNVLKRNTFGGLKNLEVLNAGKNKIRHIENGAFNDLPNLITLDLTQNHLETIPSDIFNGLSNLQTLFLELNGIKTLEDRAFSGLSRLTMLDLAHNSIEKINCDTFNSLEELETLYLNRNKINRIENDFDLPKITFIELGNNELPSLSLTVFKKLNTVLSIDLSYNKLRDLSEEPFLDLESLKHVNLKNNNLREKNSSFTNLRKTAMIVL